MSASVCCSLYAQRQQLNDAILADLTDNAAAMEPVDTLWQHQNYSTPHARANIVYADQQLQPPSDRPGSVKLVDVKQEPAAKQSSHKQSNQESLQLLLAKLEDNLAKELCHISEQDHLTMTQLLKPVQVCCTFLCLHAACNWAHCCTWCCTGCGSDHVHLLLAQCWHNVNNMSCACWNAAGHALCCTLLQYTIHLAKVSCLAAHAGSMVCHSSLPRPL